MEQARVLAAGKHVFTEKPSASNAIEAQEVASQVSGSPTGTVLRGLSLRLPPADRRLHEIILASGELGELAARRDRDGHAGAGRDRSRAGRWNSAAGALMDLGCYSLHSMRMLARGRRRRARPGRRDRRRTGGSPRRRRMGHRRTAVPERGHRHRRLQHGQRSPPDEPPTDRQHAGRRSSPTSSIRTTTTGSSSPPKTAPAPNTRQPLLLHLPTRSVHHGGHAPAYPPTDAVDAVKTMRADRPVLRGNGNAAAAEPGLSATLDGTPIDATASRAPARRRK